MMLTCYSCPRQLCFHGKKRDVMAKLFGWLIRNGRYFCQSCSEEEASSS